jgi:hypothetical protein
MRELRLGPAHPETARSLDGLAFLLSGLGRHDEAEPLYQRALTAMRDSLGDNHPLVVGCLLSLADLREKHGDKGR